MIMIIMIVIVIIIIIPVTNNDNKNNNNATHTHIPSKTSLPADVLDTLPNKTKYSRIIVFVQLNGRNTHFDIFVFQLNFEDSTRVSNSFDIS